MNPRAARGDEGAGRRSRPHDEPAERAMANSRKQGPKFTATLAVLWRTFCRDAFDSYRPELHYMRGPGPKWREKHARAYAAGPYSAGELARISI